MLVLTCYSDGVQASNTCRLTGLGLGIDANRVSRLACMLADGEAEKIVARADQRHISHSQRQVAQLLFQYFR